MPRLPVASHHSQVQAKYESEVRYQGPNIQYYNSIQAYTVLVREVLIGGLTTEPLAHRISVLWRHIAQFSRTSQSRMA